VYGLPDAMTAPPLETAEAGGLTLAYRERGSGPAVLLLHGWPTSSYLWRDVMPPIATRNRVIAVDLPGFGGSDKPVDAAYDFDFFEGALDGFLAALDVDDVALAVHDLGGPVGVHWALHRRERVRKLALLNTLVYPEFSPAVMEFVQALMTPGPREELTSPKGLEEGLRLGLADAAHATPEVIAGVIEPFASDDARRALADAGIGLELEVFSSIAERIGSLSVPMRVIYGAKDRILPDVAETMARIKRDLPQTEITALPDCGHFLQEEAPEQIGGLLADFFATG